MRHHLTVVSGENSKAAISPNKASAPADPSMTATSTIAIMMNKRWVATSAKVVGD
jgi:hypothetical protein